MNLYGEERLHANKKGDLLVGRRLVVTNIHSALYSLLHEEIEKMKESSNDEETKKITEYHDNIFLHYSRGQVWKHFPLSPWKGKVLELYKQRKEQLRDEKYK